MRFVFALALAVHGVAHLVGFVSSWKLAVLPELPYKTTIFGGRLDIGDTGVRAIGLLWLLAAVTFLLTAAATAVHAQWTPRLALFAAIGSLLLCVAGWPDSRIGLAVNVGLLLVLALGAGLILPALKP